MCTTSQDLSPHGEEPALCQGTEHRTQRLCKLTECPHDLEGPRVKGLAFFFYLTSLLLIDFQYYNSLIPAVLKLFLSSLFKFNFYRAAKG